jgi:hypothetical protein
MKIYGLIAQIILLLASVILIATACYYNDLWLYMCSINCEILCLALIINEGE